jgi:uncharacterized protein
VIEPDAAGRVAIEPVMIEPGKFAQGRRQISGTLAPAALPRLSDVLFDTAGEVRYAVAGSVNERGHASLRLALDGELNLRCQRCLGPLAYHVESRRDIVLVADADEFAQGEDAADTEDVIPEVARLDLTALLEDELVLALPLSARHEDGACEVQDAAGEGAEPDKPFAALAQLRRGS